MTTQENYLAVKAGKRGMLYYDHWEELPFPIEASLMTPHLSFETIVEKSVTDALSRAVIAKDRTIFILSSTKGDIENLDKGKAVRPLGEIAKKISNSLGVTNEPIVVCNACVSGVSALILAQRLLDLGAYDYAIVCGADVQSRFIISGFQSLKALSPEPCRPFDIERHGLNLGEAAATVILANDSVKQGWEIIAGATRNDAYHISAPHPKGIGAAQALKAVIESISKADIAAVGVHGTATMYNDQMESQAIEAVGLDDIPLSALKGYFGHTMGAAGIVETILMMKSLDDGIILPSIGFETRGVSGKVTLSSKAIASDKRSFLKMLSGFGGNNAVIALNKGCGERNKRAVLYGIDSLAGIRITPDEVILNEERIPIQSQGREILTELYKDRVGDYAKFYKMDMLSKLAFIASEMLLSFFKPEEKDGTAIIFFNRTSSIAADRHYEESIREKDKFFPSPAAFVYTLPNIALAEIAIRHELHGETTFYILPERDEKVMRQVIETSFLDKHTERIIGGWIDCPDENNFICEIKIYQKQWKY